MDGFFATAAFFRVGFLAALRVGFFAPAALVVLRFFVFVDGFFAAFFCFFGNADAGFAFRFAAVGCFLAAPIAAPERAPITVPMTGRPTNSPGYSTSNCATQGAPSGAPGFVSRVLFLVVVHVLPPSWRDDARPLKPTCQRALSFYSPARAGIFERRLVVDLLLGASRLGSDCAAFPCPWRPPSGSLAREALSLGLGLGMRCYSVGSSLDLPHPRRNIRSEAQGAAL